MLWRYEDQGMEAKFDGPMMYRAVDVQAVLKSMPCEEDLEFSIGVEDPHLSENRGPWKVHASKGSVSVEKTNTADFEMRIEPFTQAALGEPSLSVVLKQGEVRVHNKEGLDAALRFFTPHPTFCLDFF
jgi:predicted acetyltransferase